VPKSNDSKALPQPPQGLSGRAREALADKAVQVDWQSLRRALTLGRKGQLGMGKRAHAWVPPGLHVVQGHHTDQVLKHQQVSSSNIFLLIDFLLCTGQNAKKCCRS
jgi:hypothetical protein